MSLDPDVYRALCHTAGMTSAPLLAAITRIGPIDIVPPTHANVADRLFVEIVNQQLSTKAALTIWGRVEAAAASRGMVPRDLFVPGLEEVVRACGVSGNKVRALHAIRDAERVGILDSDLSLIPHEERSAILCQIRGVGRWTADMIGIFHCLDPDIWPVGDVAAVGSLRLLTGCEDTTTVAAKFSPYRSILARYMWRSRDSAAVVAQKAA